MQERSVWESLVRTVGTVVITFVSVCSCANVAAATEAAGAQPEPSQAIRPIGTQRMVQLLEYIAQQSDPRGNAYLNGQRADLYAAKFAAVTDMSLKLSDQINTSVELIRAGRARQGIELIQTVLQTISQGGFGLSDQSRNEINELLALAYLRQAEQENCIGHHDTDSCLVPIKGSGVHIERDGSRGAIQTYEQLLQADPDNMELIWLLNLAYMTLGEYPDKVPSPYRIPVGVFDSDYDIKRFPDVAARLGLAVFSLAGGSITEDFDLDGDLDLMVSGWGLREQIRYFRNNGDGSFTEQTKEAGLIGIVGGLNMVLADYDNNGHADVLVLRGAWLDEYGKHPNSLLRNTGNAVFEDVTEAAGLISYHPTQTASWADYNNDGWLDLFVGNETVSTNKHPCQLYHNNGDGTFTDIAAKVGVAHLGHIKGVAFGDYDNDGRPDLYISSRGHPNALYHNDGPADPAVDPQAKPGTFLPWRFRDVSSQAHVQEPIPSFPTWFFDYNNDGWLDILVFGYHWTSVGDVAANYMGKPHKAELPRLYRNDQDGTFTNVTAEAHLDKVMMPMGCNFGDLDNDGFLDFYVGTGTPNLRSVAPNRMFRNAGGKFFQDVTTAGGFGHIQKGHGVAFADLDHDGDQDVYAVMGGAYSGDGFFNALYLNPGHGNHWITLRIRGVQSNRSAIGARIHVRVTTADGSVDIHRRVTTGGSFGCSSLRQEIGLGSASAIDFIDIHWPTTGKTQHITGLEMDRFYDVREDQEQPTPYQPPRFNLAD